jgi:hypothetical protein
VPWVIRDVVNDLNKAVARRWHSVDPLLPEPNDLPEGCTAPFLARGPDRRRAAAGRGLDRGHDPAGRHRMGYRPLWTIWEARPAAALR